MESLTKEIPMAFTNDRIARLNTSFGLIKPRLSQVADLFEQALNESTPDLAPHFPMDRVSFELNMLLLCGHIADMDLLADRYAEIGEDLSALGINEYHYPFARDAMIRAFGAVCGYTWTQRLVDDWTAVFDHIGHAAWNSIDAHSHAA